jgi:hypothetical protein
MGSGKRLFMRAASILVALIAWGNGIMLAVYKIQLRAPTRRIDLLPGLQFVFGGTAGFVLDGLLWISVGTGLVIYVFRRTSFRAEVHVVNMDES